MEEITRQHPFSARSYPAKLLLFGEYTVLLGYPALALPLHLYQGSMILENNPDPIPIWNEWMAFLHQEVNSKEAFLDLARMQREYEEGWRFHSTIPIGYGLGSSGVLCAAILGRYGTDLTRQNGPIVDWTKKILAGMESFFHEKSSGIDPLVSFYDQAFVIESQGKITPLERTKPLLLNHFYLVDSQGKRDTARWVKHFHEKCSHSQFMEAMQSTGLLQQSCLEAYLNHSDLSAPIQTLSVAQFQYMQDWIPASVLSIWEEGLTSGDYFMKLCGAGGGGFFLLYSTTPQKLPSSISVISLGV